MTIEQILRKNDITESSLYFSRAKAAMEQFGKQKWREAQDDAAKKQVSISQSGKGAVPLYSKTNYKP